MVRMKGKLSINLHTFKWVMIICQCAILRSTPQRFVTLLYRLSWCVLLFFPQLLLIMSSRRHCIRHMATSRYIWFLSPSSLVTLHRLKSSVRLFQKRPRWGASPQRLSCFRHDFKNFLALCASNYYDDCIFHRSIKSFMIQTGDPSGSGKGGQSIWGSPFSDEIRSTLKVKLTSMDGTS